MNNEIGKKRGRNSRGRSSKERVITIEGVTKKRGKRGGKGSIKYSNREEGGK
jgi:hypothetical protein